jgi:hypothetical protein
MSRDQSQFQEEASFASSSLVRSSPSPLTIESQGLQILQQSLKMASNTTRKVTMPDGTTIEVHDQAKVVSSIAEFVEITSAERVNLDAKEQDTTERHFGKYDLHQIFMVVDPERDNSGQILPSLKAGSRYRNLFQWYAVLKVEDITTSNQWYRTFPTETWYNDNMGITYEYLKTHMATDLWMKVNEEDNTYPSEAKGRPLFLYHMIHQLIAANETITTTLSNRIDSVKISAYKGEDVGEAVTHLRAIIHRLKNMRRRDVSGNEIDLVPLDLSKRLYKIFQTSSSLEFNSLFQNQYNMEYTKSLISGQSAWSDPEQVLVLAHNLYVRLCADNNWNGIDQQKATFPVFKSPQAATAFLGKINCHNCGGPHYSTGLHGGSQSRPHLRKQETGPVVTDLASARLDAATLIVPIV